MRLNEIKAGPARPGLAPGPAEPPNAEETGASRALVALAPSLASASHNGPARRPAAFLAHLIATQGQHPQTRERRRAAPDEVLAAYRATVALLSRR